ncbi:hypothetical protein EhV257 [Emiliania huxleyi virus 86]|uniref:Uncharacterized protein n=1 Tax=Emiliania huxleyi virus 86 (isolate United Kingdom/English Channel/1999) TaxID=654925 RepID=Q4A2M5_EHV8U|nr:hypothetical protein EhV257 [Emiliania huxleyi virus 86]CAI65681.1 hypothetical protein EhV257 [Emiliania huxleyi virus 86]
MAFDIILSMNNKWRTRLQKLKIYKIILDLHFIN